MTKNIVFSNGHVETEERTLYALNFLEEIEKVWGTDFVQAPTKNEVSL